MKWFLYLVFILVGIGFVYSIVSVDVKEGAKKARVIDIVIFTKETKGK